MYTQRILKPLTSQKTPFINEKDVYAYTFCVIVGVFIILLCDIFAYKIIYLFGIKMVTSGLLFPFAIFISDIITERWGVRQSLVFMSFVTCFGVLGNFFLWLLSTIPGDNDYLWRKVFHLNWVVMMSTLFGIAISFTFNAYAINFIKNTIYSISFFGIYIRDTLCNFVSKFLLVFVSYNITFFSSKSFREIIALIIGTLIFKVIVGSIINLSIPSILNQMKKIIGV